MIAARGKEGREEGKEKGREGGPREDPYAPEGNAGSDIFSKGWCC